MSQATQETEIKLAVKDARSTRRRLREAGFVVSRPRVFEVNTVFDTPELGLRASSRLLRIRQAGRVALVAAFLTMAASLEAQPAAHERAAGSCDAAHGAFWGGVRGEVQSGGQLHSLWVHGPVDK